MPRPPKNDVRMSEKIEVKVTSEQKEFIRMALNSTGTAGTAAAVRDVLLRTASDLLLVEAGKLTPDEAGRRYAAFIASATDLPLFSVKMESAEDESEK